MKKEHVLLCWQAVRAGDDVLINAVKKLESKLGTRIDRIMLLQQEEQQLNIDDDLSKRVNSELIELSDPTEHSLVYQKIVEQVLPKIKGITNLHINVSPGTPAMHSVWLILHAGGRFPPTTKLWSTQRNPKTKRTSLKPVNFNISTYMAEIREQSYTTPNMAIYEVEPVSKDRREAFEQLKRFTSIPHVPLLVLGERGTGKTRLIETFVKATKQKEVVTIACGGLDSSVAESLIFGHKKGAFTGATSDREGILKSADGKVLFLDEIQDLPQTVQRKLVRVLQDYQHRYRPIGADKEETSSFELICASNKNCSELAGVLDADFLDRISMLKVTIPALRNCRQDLKNDWQQVWDELNVNNLYSKIAPMSSDLEEIFQTDALPGNIRDLQKLAVLIMAYWDESDAQKCISVGIKLWETDRSRFVRPPFNDDSSLSRDEHLSRFKSDLAIWAKDRFGTWKQAAEHLDCSDRILRDDAKVSS
ncbi:sigma 54-interacting transcriptional regulator [Vibrio parahaemolyticus]|uniref:sigma 54-interacting transcriptional regulator n=1 Tax=Vibrio parahaemolyticus TaxID=670 RepID=UPI001B83E252|nr:sigma 54-interacting transcriptional regulator [Vibrio parahaemolyticus]MCC3796124.1 sigma 54-interacting transcriptional regulator [Vibrio parahaemolyticus]MCC3810996.1 sigma 54-interacting transcriptional regulator [Vibrio parahaemolyticus]HBC3950823.1 sigma 54-interacting transcriptional regulator [Vibrio parahaemolyticus]